ncbi:hypothetical protein [Brevibacillus daliensis]|uniref:hypothetical protein n=1 Tax=Brevibacillus daliensis TaxID=2892995 RepID=UPI001E484549|nr:hypothetical protein [Brevibacillus daliensis]
MKHVMVIEVVAKKTFDEEATLMLDALTPDQLTERLDEIKTETHRLFSREMEDGAEIVVSVRIEEDE